MGIGGINSCVISHPWDPAYVDEHLSALAMTGKSST